MNLPILPLTHDLSCTIGELAMAAGRFTAGSKLSSTNPSRLLLRSAIAFTIQFAIEADPNCEPTALRTLERKLLAMLEGE